MQGIKDQDASSCLKQLKDIRKKKHDCLLNSIDYLKITELWVPEVTDHTVALKKYAEVARSLCLLMNMQDPPMSLCLDVSENQLFDSNLFRSYTTSGRFYEYLVWPAVRLTDGGALVSKGIAQGKYTNGKGDTAEEKGNYPNNQGAVHTNPRGGYLQANRDKIKPSNKSSDCFKLSIENNEQQQVVEITEPKTPNGTVLNQFDPASNNTTKKLTMLDVVELEGKNSDEDSENRNKTCLESSPPVSGRSMTGARERRRSRKSAEFQMERKQNASSIYLEQS